VVALLALAVLAAGGSGTWSAFSATTSTGADTFSAAADWTGPTVGAAVVANSSAGAGVKQGGTYNVYANVADSGNPASGVAGVTANVSNITTGSTAVALTACSSACTVGGTTYGYKSAQLTAKNPLTAGTQTFTVSSTDAGGNAGTTFNGTVTVDNTAPPSPTGVIAHGTSQTGVGKNATYYVYANASDAGVGIGTVTANVSSITSGQTAVALTACSGSCTVAGTTYAYKSAQLTSDGTLTGTAKSWSLTATDLAGNSTTANLSVTPDVTAPAASNEVASNGSTLTGKPEAGDTIVLTYTEQMDLDTILSGWTGTSTPIVVRITNSGGNDIVSFWNSTNTVQLPLGTLDLNRAGYVNTNSTATFGASGTASTMVRSTTNPTALTITLGTLAGTTNRVTNSTTLKWTPSAATTDLVGNATSTTTDTGTSRRQF
jgi:hypothetical protein